MIFRKAKIKLDLGSIAAISRFYDRKIAYVSNRSRITKHAFKEAYKTVVVCLKAEKNRDAISFEEYENITKEIEAAYAEAMNIKRKLL